jgi:HD-like signal output (HDOD) protein
VFSAFQPTGVTQFFIAQLQRHSMMTGTGAAAMAKIENLPKKACDSSLIGGFLHDVGKLILAANYPKEYEGVLSASQEQRLACHEMELQIFGATHAEIGSYLLWLWGLPDAVCNAVAFHHKPTESSATALTAAGIIHVADALEHELSGSACHVEMDVNYLTALGLAGRLPEWRRACSKHRDDGEGA